MSELDDWTAAVTAELGLDAEVDVRLVLDLARDAAHGVARPAAPLTTYLLGVAVGRGADPADAARRISALAQQHAGARVRESGDRGDNTGLTAS